MRLSVMGSVAGAFLLVMHLPAGAAEALTLPHLQELVRSNAPAVLQARTALEEEQGARQGATPLFAQNPSITGGAGITAQPSGWRPHQWEAGGAGQIQLQVPVELGGQRWMRVALADARIRARERQGEVAQWAAQGVATETFYRALHAQQQARLAKEALEVARRFNRAAQQLRHSGLGTTLDVQLASWEEAEAAQTQLALHAVSVRWRTEMLAMVGLAPDAWTLSGSLRSDQPLPTLAAALENAQQRPDVQALRAGRSASLREASVAAAEALPTPTFGASYQYQYQFPAPQHVMLGQVSFPLPLFSRGQGDVARARARARGLADQEHQAVTRARAEIRAAYALVQELRAARKAMSAQDLDGARVPQELEQAYLQRTADLSTLLNVQRHVIAMRRASLDLDLQEALARVWLNLSIGVQQ